MCNGGQESNEISVYTDALSSINLSTMSNEIHIDGIIVNMQIQ